ncbi:MAG: TIGR00730 family Rossman fold protein [Oscillospiraceae bacterium]|nr:TIGR00730 family Rossman fold protein [Oscillospiraceae bacterium]
MKICIFGASSDHLAARYYQEAEVLGRLIAAEGHSLIFGGGVGGLMGACASAALTAGGRVIGIAPRIFDEPGILLEGCDELLFTETMSERKTRMTELSDAYIALPGGIGTMDEFFEVITLLQLGLAHGTLVLLNTGGFYDSLLSFLREMAEGGFMSRHCLDLISVVSTPEEALRAALTAPSLEGNIRRLEDYTR